MISFDATREHFMRRQIKAVILMIVFLCVGAAVANDHGDAKLVVAGFDRKIVDEHKQLFDFSCIPANIELVLKLTGREPVSFFKLQEAWSTKTNGSFADFDGKTIAGLTFHQRFKNPRNKDFPLKRLMSVIDKELSSGRYVIVSLQSGKDVWHIHVIYGKDADGDFVAITKVGSKASGTKTIVVPHIKELLTRMEGTDIMTYEETEPVKHKK
jgi:hypothetical protein